MNHKNIQAGKAFCSITLLCLSLGEALLEETFPIMKDIFPVVVLSVSEGLNNKIK